MPEFGSVLTLLIKSNAPRTVNKRNLRLDQRLIKQKKPIAELVI